MLGKRGNYYQDTLYVIFKELIKYFFHHKHLSNMEKLLSMLSQWRDGNERININEPNFS